MIQVNISEIRNRLSYYLRLVQGGEQIEIIDRKTPVARITHVSQVKPGKTHTPWIKELEQLGIVNPPNELDFPQDLLDKQDLALPSRPAKTGVLKALLEERETGR
ncbi:MAG: hypothetical protein PVG44_14360 [Desulfobacterales bacterium]|jgi:antitoxin (DNA-binding transcriptional repressor) of toxin-antitoxin stability system